MHRSLISTSLGVTRRAFRRPRTGSRHIAHGITLTSLLAIASGFGPGSASAQAQYTLAGANATTDIAVDDDLDVYRNGSLIYASSKVAGSGPELPPISILANIGDTLRFVVRDTYGQCARLEPIYIHAAAGRKTLADAGFNLGCGRPVGNLGEVHEVSFQIPDFAVTLLNAVLPGRTLAGVVPGTLGRLFGTTYDGGANGHGTIYAISKAFWGLTVLHDFTGDDGRVPFSEVTLGTGAAAGKLFGTTRLGGPGGGGTVYSFDIASGQLTTLAPFYSFLPYQAPSGPLLQIGDVLYGGSSGAGSAIFSVGIDGTGFQVLRQLDASEGRDIGALTLGPSGFLYGTAYYGGDFTCDTFSGCGTTFRIRPDGSDFALLHVFGPNRFFDSGPSRKLLLGSDGRLYGTIVRRVFSLAPDPAAPDFQIVRSLGFNLAAPPVQGSDGRIYFSDYYGGEEQAGTVFSMSTAGLDLLVEHDSSFTGAYGPSGILYRDAAGTIFGTTEYSDPPGPGVLFKEIAVLSYCGIGPELILLLPLLGWRRWCDGRGRAGAERSAR